MKIQEKDEKSFPIIQNLIKNREKTNPPQNTLEQLNNAILTLWIYTLISNQVVLC